MLEITNELLHLVHRGVAYGSLDQWRSVAFQIRHAIAMSYRAVKKKSN